MPRHVKKGDSVVITSGAFRGAVGEVARIVTKSDRVVVQFPASVYDNEKRKQILKNRKPTRVNPQGGRVALDRSFHISNVSPAVDGKPSRVRFEIRPDGSKVRVAVRSGKELSVLHGPRDSSKRGANAGAAKATKKAPKAKAPAQKKAAKKTTKKTTKKSSKKAS